MIVDRIRQFIDRHHIEGRILAASSGGVDSTALLIALSETGAPLICGHVNHHLRGEESDADERFVRELCARLGVELHVADGTLDAESIRASGLEAAARDVRAHLLHEIAAAHGAKYVATGHQKNDQAETVVMRLLSGTGLAGLRGIHAMREDGMIRPLLDMTREEIERFLEERGISPRHDRMNVDPRFLRNRVREMLREFGPAAVENIASLADQAQQIWPVIEKTLDEIERSSVHVTDEETRFIRWPADRWWRQALLYRHIRRLGRAREISSRDLERLADSVESIKRVSVTKELELVRQQSTLVLRRAPKPTGEFEVGLSLGENVYIAPARANVSVRRIQNPKSKIQNVFQLPNDDEPRFTVRNRRPGDRFHPLGMAQDKKLKDFLIDRKIPAEIRDRIPLLIWRDEIVWVGGVAVSERFKVTDLAGDLYEVVLEDASQEDQDSLQR